MPKINKEEYQVLKGLDDKWKWIARNRDGGLYKFQETPEKVDNFRWNDRGQTWLGIYGNLFQFIQWEDENPYNIPELIEEYEDKEFYDYVGWEHHKSEEKKVKKGIKRLKEEISKLRGYAVIIDGEDGEWEPVTTVSVEDIYELINQLDKLGVLSQEWIDEKAIHIRGLGNIIEEETIKNLLVPKQELPVIPEFVANWIEEVRKQDKTLIFAITHIYAENEIGESPSKEEKRLYQWMESADNEEVFARAWLDGFMVEKEQKYYVINNDQRMMLVRMMDGKTITEADPFKLEDMSEVEKKSHQLTEQEIKDYDPRYWAFRKPVEELEG